MNKIIARTLAVSLIILGAGTLGAGPAPSPAKITVDTEMSSDCDSAGALAVLNHLADLGEAEILACVADAVEPDKAIAASISAINTYYGRPQIPISAYQSPVIRPGKSHYTTLIRDEFPQHAPSDDQAPQALVVYRTALAAAPNGSVTIVSLGFLVNLRDLLQSKPDAVSPLTGAELIQSKVKRLVVVGGFFPYDKSSSRTTPEYNFGGANPAGALDTQFVTEHWPTEILFSGAELAQGICTGPSLIATNPSNPVRRIYELNGALKTGRSSWCQTAVFAAVRDPALYWEVKGAGYRAVAPNGQSRWTLEPHRGHSYLAPKVSQPEMAKLIGDLMAAPPATTVQPKP